MKAPRGERLDVELVRRSLVESRSRAQALILAGEVLVAETVCDKVGTRVAPDAAIRVRGEALPYVSRGGLKLAFALDRFAVDPAGCVCADLGASTGGFSDCLLQRGATRVYAIDVGYGQLAWSLRKDPRVVVMERTNVRHLERLPEPVDLVVGDLSFISLTLVLPAIARLRPPRCVLLVKPQFEVGRGQVGKGGLVRDESARQAAVEAVSRAARGAGFEVEGVAESPVPGAKAGNVEWLLFLSARVVESARP